MAEELCQGHGQQGILPEVYRVLAQAYLGASAIHEARRYAQLALHTVDEEDAYSRGTTGVILGLVLQHEGLVQEAGETLSQALTYLEEAGEAFELGWGHLMTAQLLLSVSDRAGAAGHLRQARAVFKALQAEAKVRRIDELLGQT